MTTQIPGEKKYDTRTFPNTVNLVVREFEERGMSITYRGWVNKDDEAHRGYIIVIDNEFRYYLKWEKERYGAVFVEVNQKYGYNTMAKGTLCRTFSIQAFEDYLNLQYHPGGSILFAHSKDPYVLHIPTEKASSTPFRIIQKVNDEPVLVLLESEMTLFTTGDNKPEILVKAGPDQVQTKNEQEEQPKDLDLTKTTATTTPTEPEPEPIESPVVIDNPDEVFVEDTDPGEQGTMDSWFGSSSEEVEPIEPPTDEEIEKMAQVADYEGDYA